MAYLWSGHYIFWSFPSLFKYMMRGVGGSDDGLMHKLCDHGKICWKCPHIKTVFVCIDFQTFFGPFLWINSTMFDLSAIASVFAAIECVIISLGNAIPP